MRTVSNVSFVLAAGLVGGCILGDGQQTDDSSTVPIARLSGAIFTTLPDGTRVNANIYSSKDSVYLDGGPGDQAPQPAAALPDGDYYFQVTDPSGRMLLSTDAIECREVQVVNGIISSVGPASCAHLTGDDVDHGALTVQLMPYLDTPNPGGEYKVWITRVADYSTSFTRFHGFRPSESKTDNFKIRQPEETPPPPPPCSGDECNPPPPPPPCGVCGDGHLDAGEECDDGNLVNGDGCSSTCTVETPTCPGH